jgi:glyoxylase-like metal-dependent hydrolase (beta-lactamase superfamily II)
LIIKKGIHQLQAPMRRNPLGKTFSYLLEESKTLIDTGVGTEDAYLGLKKELKRANFLPQDIEKIIITHLHHDHIGLSKRFRDHGAKIIASNKAVERQKEFLELWDHLYDLAEKELKLFGGTRHFNDLKKYEYVFRRSYEPFIIDDQIEDGQTLDLPGIKLKIYWTPGHAFEHICLLNKEDKILFSGDHILPKITSHVSLHIYQDMDPLNDYLNSLMKVRDLDVNAILPGHEQIFYDLKGRVDHLFDHHKNRLLEMMRAIQNGSKTVFEVSSDVHWDSRPWPQMSFWTKRMAASETYAHLIYLKNKGEIVEELGEELNYSIA